MDFDTYVKYLDMTGAARKLYARFLEPLCRKWELGRNEVDVILFLYNHPGLDRAVDISGGRGIAKSYVSQAVAGLERRGLLLREFDPADRRTAHLVLTDPGRGIAREGRRVQLAFFDAVYGVVTPQELSILSHIVNKVTENIEKLTEEI